jgi:LmbE family N-acetylglucosaminyl deacetylase
MLHGAHTSAHRIREFPASSAPGSAEAAWLRLLADRPRWSPPDGPLIVVSPHPNDEVLGAGGLIHTWAATGRPVTIVSVTDGEAARPERRRFDLIRREELKGALRKLCLTHVAVVRVGLPDGAVAGHANRLRNAVLALLEPGATLLAPYDHDGHCDHEAAGEVCCGLGRSHGVTVARFPVETWSHAASPSLIAAPWVVFPLSFEARRAKARAVQCFASRQPCTVEPFARPYEAFIV